MCSGAYQLPMKRVPQCTDFCPSLLQYADACRVVLGAAWGRPVTQVLSEISPEPVAAASLGQVYRGRLADGGQQVAVKVQRPAVLASIGLDLFVMRNVAAAIQSLPSVRSRCLEPLHVDLSSMCNVGSRSARIRYIVVPEALARKPTLEPQTL